ncbi:hypothetical protein P5673_010134, partial [Acropora cervicornis]
YRPFVVVVTQSDKEQKCSEVKVGKSPCNEHEIQEGIPTKEPGEDKLEQRKRKPKVCIVQCLHPECNHYSESNCCNFFAFPEEVKKKALFGKWKLLLRCHVRDGDKLKLPTISNRHKNKLFDVLHGAEAEPPPVKKIKSTTDANLPTVRSVLAEIKENSGPSASTNKQDESRDSRDTS